MECLREMGGLSEMNGMREIVGLRYCRWVIYERCMYGLLKKGDLI